MNPSNICQQMLYIPLKVLEEKNARFR